MARISGSGKSERELIDFARSYLSEAFPNPERRNCPPDRALRRLAFRAIAGEDSLTSHLTCCSPCFEAYMAHLAEAKTQNIAFRPIPRMAWTVRPVLALGAAAIVLVGVYFLFTHPPISGLLIRLRRPVPVTKPAPPAPEPIVATYLPVAIDLSNRSPARALEPPRSLSKPTLFNAKLALTVHLPLGSEAGAYLVRIRFKSRVVWSKSVQARRKNRGVLLATQADLSQLPAGDYDFEVRSKALDLKVPVLVRSPSLGPNQ